MLIASLVLNVVLLAVIGYIYYPLLRKLWTKQITIAREVDWRPEIPKCPICKKELIGKIKRAASGQWCCEHCFITVFNNKSW